MDPFTNFLHARKVFRFDGTAGKGAVGYCPFFTINSGGRVLLMIQTNYITEELVSEGGGKIDFSPVESGGFFAQPKLVNGAEKWFHNSAGYDGFDATPGDQLAHALGDISGTIQASLALAEDWGAWVTVAPITEGEIVTDVWYLRATPTGRLRAVV